MKVTVKTSGLLGGFRASAAPNDGVEITLLPGTTVGGLLARIGLSGNDSYLVIVNDSTVARERRATHVLRDGDRVSIVPPLKGG